MSNSELIQIFIKDYYFEIDDNCMNWFNDNIEEIQVLLNEKEDFHYA